MITLPTRRLPSRRVRFLALTLSLAAASGLRAGAQVADAGVDIVALDESGGALPGVTVTVARPDTGFQQTVVTDSVGIARAIAIPTGVYEVKLELAGFASVVEKGVTLRVGQTVRLVATLKVAQVAETVSVVAQAALVDVYKTDSSTNIVPEQIQSLPVADRDFQRLAFLTPGVQRERGGNRFIGNSAVIGAAGNADDHGRRSRLYGSGPRAGARASARRRSASSALSPIDSTPRSVDPPAARCRS